MRIVQIPSNRQRVAARPRSKTKKLPLLLVPVVVCGLVVNYVRPLPNATIRLALPPTPPAAATELSWPAYGQSSLAAEGYGILGLSGTQRPLSTASIAKVITALCVLEKHPLGLNETGPVITMTEADVVLYQNQVEDNGSRLYVEPGERLTQYKALQALLIPSANNIADSLAIWAFGSLPAYQRYANEYVTRHGLTNTKVGSDASGLDPSTTSTAEDLARLGLIAMQHPVVREIASQQSTIFPLVGEMTNYNSKLSGGVLNGIKTGNNDQNLGALLYAAPVTIGDKTITITGAVMDANDLEQALDSSEALARSVQDDFETVTFARKQQRLGTAITAWGATAPVVASKDISLIRWRGSAVTQTHTLVETQATSSGPVGTVAVQAGQVKTSGSLVLERSATPPSIWWRLTRSPW